MNLACALRFLEERVVLLTVSWILDVKGCWITRWFVLVPVFLNVSTYCHHKVAYCPLIQARDGLCSKGSQWEKAMFKETLSWLSTLLSWWRLIESFSEFWKRLRFSIKVIVKDGSDKLLMLATWSFQSYVESFVYLHWLGLDKQQSV